MSEPSLGRSERADHARQGRLHYVRAQRQQLVRETRMLHLALEELQEEAEEASEKEALLRRAIDEKHRELLRCLIHLSTAELDTSRANSRAIGTPVQRDATRFLVCAVLRQYKIEEDAFTQEMARLLEDVRREARQSCLGVGDTSAVHLSDEDCSGGVDSIAEDAERRPPFRSELEALREMKATEDEDMDAALLRIGCALFC
ncbi:hypothetical protein LSCM1_02020 [Leishmania martiniquensis]|uniref:Uncharacterized protein n=1 Tax=Leishmania martiniquensis TaxID=1580590 RepID=A0A836H4J8_9TRYP|nr:hypothetical protein LSCM1_02020 [Leishmania martiniquensis]